MEVIGGFLKKYRKLTEYRDVIAQSDFANNNLRGFFIITLISLVSLLVDVLLVRLRAAETAGTISVLGLVGFLAAAELLAVFALCTGKRGRELECLRFVAMSVEFAGVIYLMYQEYKLSGGLYTYTTSLLVICSLMNLRLRESTLAILLFDFSYVAFGYFATPASGPMTFMNPYNFLVLSSVLAFFVAMRTHIDYLVNLKQRVRLEIMSSTDPLTGLKNRRGMERFVENKNCQQRVSAVIFDVDDFKSYNDTYGHAAGDDCLRTVAGLMNRLAGCFDALPVRYGGEEFVVLFFDAPKDDVKEATINIMQEMYNLGMKSGERALLPRVTLSAGLAYTVRPIGKNAEHCYELIAKADRNLYKAKTTGKNRLVD